MALDMVVSLNQGEKVSIKVQIIKKLKESLNLDDDTVVQLNRMNELALNHLLHRIQNRIQNALHEASKQ